MVTPGTDERNKVHAKLRQTEVVAICDVTNPFFGPNGAAYTYAEQKGASPEETEQLDEGLRQGAHVVVRDFKIKLQKISGAGAGGGIGGGAVTFMGAQLKSGADLVMEMTDFDEAVKWSDIIVTGEGKLDQQTLSGKLIARVAKKAQRHGKKLIVICGINELGEAEWSSLGIDRVFSLTEEVRQACALGSTAGVIETLALKLL